jgi:hypothetical protein
MSGAARANSPRANNKLSLRLHEWRSGFGYSAICVYCCFREAITFGVDR